MKLPRIPRAPALLLAAVLASPAAAQRAPAVAFEVRGGGVAPTGAFGDRASDGWMVGGTVRLRVRNVDVYAGYQHDDLPTLVHDDETGEPVQSDGFATTDDGIRAGVRLHFPLRGTAVLPWGEAGVLYNRISLHIPGATGVGFAWGPGVEAGAGVAVDVAPKVALTPGVRLRYHEARFRDGGADYIASGISSLTFDMGVRFTP